ncbi:SDR family oxidoreductase [Algoriphagus winogradskyi]|uniref:NAD(P)-dependent dehydrogenase, short-chain alcohol dehydrogenase family n=1 Tax=Algoriphagus winogradskyi TaxID=237017 RepID=A0ABY1PDI7_9BACT|nr:SDR family oxidoreductase [Algoriphagus winogradskyi]SMP31819.1 NAD(P)-dependent dehydrogenase, short-chain alcohol dehydrogenase family [Algoriphagus winogradskyi]
MKKVLVTGSNRGIGLEIALAFGRAGYQVFATMRTPSKATTLSETIKAEELPISMHKMNVNSDISVKAIMDEILLEDGPIDILVNNAGIGLNGSIEEMPLSEFKGVFETNVFGAVRCIKAVIPAMREQKSGCIINITSVSGRLTSSPLGCYSASKFALEAISEALAQEVKPFNIRVGIVEPGIIDTDMAHEIRGASSSIYPTSKRMADLFHASLKNPTSAALVAEKILEFAESDSWYLRHPVGPDALPYIQWRQSMTDEEWINRHSLPEEEWYNSIERDFGMDARR